MRTYRAVTEVLVWAGAVLAKLVAFIFWLLFSVLGAFSGPGKEKK